MGAKKLRIAGLPPELKQTAIKETLAKFGEVIQIREEMWTRAYIFFFSLCVVSVCVIRLPDKNERKDIGITV
jgi:hypothetical protein